jgi:Uri superfamily endonuclease
MIVGLVIAGHVHLTKIARAIGSGMNRVHSDEKRLSRHLDSEHWSMRPVIDGLLNDSAAMVGENSLIVADLTDIAKYYARHLEGLGRVRDASDPEKRTAPGYMLFEAYVRVRRWQLFRF